MSEAPFAQLVMVGSSAGGIGALSKLVSTLPEDFPAPLVIAQHLDPKRESHLQQILANRSTLPVRTVADDEPLEAGVVFVVPSGQHVNITDGHIGMESESEVRPKPSVDLLLASAAEVYGERLVAVVLTFRREAEAKAARLVAQNERLVEANRRFEEANRELGVLNERLQRAYEESLMASEENQAATEEVETLNEDLQATNEELNTTNEDLQARSNDLQEMARERERERRSSETACRRLQVVLEQSPFAIVVYEGEDLVTRLVNPAFQRLFGVREADVLGRPFAEAFPALVRKGRLAPLRRVYETGEPSTERLTNFSYDRDGEEELLFLNIERVPLRDARGEVEGVLAQFVDATDVAVSRRRAEELSEKARDKGSRLEAILGGIVDAILAVDAKGEVLFSNEVFRWMFGDGLIGTDETGRSLGDFVPLTVNGEPMPLDEMPQVRASCGETFEERFAIRAEDGNLTVFEARVHPFPGGENGGGVVVIREVRREEG